MNKVVLLHPKKYDILCGKDKACLSHYGSRHFRSVIEAYRNRYQQAVTKQEKMNITREIVMTLKNRTSSRFLKYNSQLHGWEEISHIAARDKVSHALRFANRRKSPTKSINKHAEDVIIIKDDHYLSITSDKCSSSETNNLLTTQALPRQTQSTSKNELKNGHVRRVSYDDFSTLNLKENKRTSFSNKIAAFDHFKYSKPIIEEEDMYDPIPLSSINELQSELYEPIPLHSIESGHGISGGLHWIMEDPLMKELAVETF